MCNCWWLWLLSIFNNYFYTCCLKNQHHFLILQEPYFFQEAQTMSSWTWPAITKRCNLVHLWNEMCCAWLAGKIMSVLQPKRRILTGNHFTLCEGPKKKISVWGACPPGTQLFKPFCIEICGAQLDKCNCFAQWNVDAKNPTDWSHYLTEDPFFGPVAHFKRVGFYMVITAEYGLVFMYASVHSCTDRLISNGFKCVIGTQ